MPVDPVRDAAIDVLLRVFEKDAYVSNSLDRTLRRKQGLSPRGKRFLTQLAYGTARHKLLCEHIVRPLLHQPFDKLPAPIQTILRMGVFQSLFCNQVTFPAMVHTSVDLAKKRGHAGTARLVNAILNRAPQSLDDVAFPERGTADFLSVRYSLAPWLAEHWIETYGYDEAPAFAEAADEEAPRVVRVNTRVTTAEKLVGDLAKADCAAAPHPDVPNALVLADPPPTRGTLFRDGHFYIQDAASMLAPHLLEPQPGETVLDLCAAPGGKTTHLAELSEATIVALELHAHKIMPLLENQARLGHGNIRIVVADGKAPPFGSTFDRVLLDAPCTGLGTLRRHPELKWRVRAEDPARLADEQRDLLRSAASLCKIQGVLVYSVCTFTPEETQGVVEPILGELPLEAEDGPAWLNPWKIAPGTYRVLPRKGPLDGYFLMRFRKVS